MLTAMIFVKEADSMLSFYRDGFELRVDHAASEPGYAVLVGDGIRLAMHEIPDHVSATIEISTPPEPRSSAAVKLIFGVADVAATQAQLERLGGEFFETTDDEAVDAMDPEGNLFRLQII